MAQILRGLGPAASTHTPGYSVRRPATDAERRQRVDDDLFDVADVAGSVELVGDGDDRIADELAGTVVGDVATSAHGNELGADCCGIAAQVVGEVRARSVREHVRMFEEQEVLLGPPAEQRLLYRQRLAVGHPPQPPHPQWTPPHRILHADLVASNATGVA